MTSNKIALLAETVTGYAALTASSDLTTDWYLLDRKGAGLMRLQAPLADYVQMDFSPILSHVSSGVPHSSELGLSFERLARYTTQLQAAVSPLSNNLQTISGELETNSVVVTGTESSLLVEDSFTGDGAVITHFGVSDGSNDILVAPDGRILVVGSSYDGIASHFAAARYDPDGSLDSSFGFSGKVVSDFGPNMEGGATAAVLLADGRIFLAGWVGSPSTNAAVAAYSADGTVDVSFGVNGLATLDFSALSSDAADILVQSDGKLVVTGTAFVASWDFALARLNADGTLDTSFGEDGFVTTDLGSGGIERTSDSVLQSDGKVILAGGTTAQHVLLRYQIDGSLDSSFADAGKLVLDNMSPSAVAVQSDGKIVVAGGGTNGLNDQVMFKLARFNVDGSPDTSFGANGYVMTDVTASHEGIDCMTLQDDGGILVAGEGGGVMIIARYLPSGAIDSSFGAAGWVLYTQAGHASGIATQLNNDILVTGSPNSGSGSGFFVARFNEDGSLDTSGPSPVVPDRTVTAGTAFSSALPAGSFSYVDTGAGLTYSSQLANGGDLPEWLSFDSATGTYSGTAPVGSVGTLELVLSATNENNDTVAEPISLNIRRSAETLFQTGSSAGDTLVGSIIADDMFGVDGNDSLDANAGHDMVAGGAGNDALYGRVGSDTLYGGSGNDTLWGEVGSDHLYGGDGDDILSDSDGSLAGPGSDSLFGGDGNDTLTGRADAADIEMLDGGAGDDVLIATGAGTLNLTGGSGVDTFVPTSTSTGTVNALDFTTGDGGDWLEIKNLLDYSAVNGGYEGGNPFLSDQGFLRFLQVGTDTHLQFDIDGAAGSSGTWVTRLIILNTSASSITSANLRPDHLQGTSGADPLIGGLGNDFLDGAGGDDYLDGQEGNDTLLGGSGSDQMLGGTGDDSLYAADGDDSVNGGDGDDLIVAGDGSGNDAYFGGSGVDTVRYTSATAKVVVNLVTGSAAGINIGSDVLGGIENVVGGQSGDRITGDSAGNVIDGYSGSDTMVGGLGNDTYYVAVPGDVVTETSAGGVDLVISSVAGSYALTNHVENGRIANAGSANLQGNSLANTLYAGRGDNALDGSTGVDTVSYQYGLVGGATTGVNVSLAIAVAQNTGSSGSDTLTNVENLTGSGLNDTLVGSAGNNVLDGGAGDDSLVGGAGNDTYVLNRSGDVVTENQNEGIDTVNVLFGGYTLGANIENGRISTSGTAGITGNSLKNTLYAGAGNNVIKGGAGTEVDTVSYADAASGVTVSLAITTAQATGGSGTDTLTNIENLIGSGFEDVLAGSNGRNVLTGGRGKDVLTGNGGNDTFDFNALAEMGVTETTWDTITDFSLGDRIDLSTLDANTATPANDAFLGTLLAPGSSFTAAGQLKFESGVLYGTTDADGDAELAIRMLGVSTLAASDFIL